MEEIDIIELFKRVKEGKAPKEIEVNGTKYRYFKDWMTLDETYFTKAYGGEENLCYCEMNFMTKIKILDKPIIEQFYYDQSELNRFEVSVYHKIREIIRHLNKEEK